MKLPLLASIVSILVSSSLAAQTPLSDSVIRGAMQRRELIWSSEPDGLWAVGRDYKAGFAGRTVEFVPFLGSDAPHNFPVQLRLESVSIGSQFLPLAAEAAWNRDGNRVTLEHGSVREFYDASEGSLEQSFLVTEDCAAGLVLKLSVESELERGSDAQGLVLSNERGGVRISSAFAIDAEGTRVEAPTRWTEHGLSIEVPAGLRAPVTIDPVISAFTVINTTANEGSPDVAWSRGSQHWLVAWEETVSSTDHDAYFVLLNLDGSPVNGQIGILDGGTSDSVNPRTCSFASDASFLTVIQQKNGAYWNLMISEFDAASGAFLAGNAIIAPSNFINPVLGGSLGTSGTNHCMLVCEHVVSSSQHEINGYVIDSGVLVASAFVIDGGAGVYDMEPAISRTAGSGPQASQAWTVVWTRAFGISGADLYGAQFAADGTQIAPVFPIAIGAEVTRLPSVSSLTDATPRRYLVTYSRGAGLGSDFDIWGQLMEGSTIIDSQDLTALVGGNTSQMQYESAVDCNGHDFEFVWSESAIGSTTNTDLYEATIVQTGSKLAAAGNPNPVSNSVWPDNQPRVCTCTGDSTSWRNSLCVFRREGGPAYYDDIGGARMATSPFTKYCAPGSGLTIACPCGNAPTGAQRGCNNSSNSGGGELDASGDPDADSVVLAASSMRPNATCVFLQGATSNPAGISFGDGVRCAAGQLLRLSVKTTSASSASSFPAAGDPSIKTRCQTLGAPIAFGQTRAYQVYYRDPASFGCASPATFNITSALQVQW